MEDGEFDDGAVGFGKGAEGGGDVEGFGGCGLGPAVESFGFYVGDVFHFGFESFAAFAAPEFVDPNLPGDEEEEGGEFGGGFVAAAVGVDAQEGLLHEVFRIIFNAGAEEVVQEFFLVALDEPGKGVAVVVPDAEHQGNVFVVFCVLRFGHAGERLKAKG